MTKKMKLLPKGISIVGLGFLIFAVVAVPLVLLTDVQAGAVPIVTTPTNAEVATSTATDIVFSFTPSVAYQTGDTFTFTWDSDFSSALGASGDITVADSGTLSVDSYALNADNAVITLANGPSSGNITVTIGDGAGGQLTSPGTAGNYKMTYTSTNTSADHGAFFIYVGDDNDVEVTATVETTLAFAIMNTDLTLETNSCDLGTLSTTTVSTCTYELKITTNAASGYQVEINAASGLDYGTHDIDSVSDGDVTAGSEEYGILLDAGSLTSGAGITLGGSFPAATDVLVPETITTLFTANGPNAPTANTETATLIHSASIDAETPPGAYTQTVSYYVTPLF